MGKVVKPSCYPVAKRPGPRFNWFLPDSANACQQSRDRGEARPRVRPRAGLLNPPRRFSHVDDSRQGFRARRSWPSVRGFSSTARLACRATVCFRAAFGGSAARIVPRGADPANKCGRGRMRFAQQTTKFFRIWVCGRERSAPSATRTPRADHDASGRERGTILTTLLP